jgi:hypothetical protein
VGPIIYTIEHPDGTTEQARMPSYFPSEEDRRDEREAPKSANVNPANASMPTPRTKKKKNTVATASRTAPMICCEAIVPRG